MNPERMIYIAQTAPSVKALVGQVQEAMMNGWLPLGGMTYGAGQYHQSMVMEIEITKEDIDEAINNEDKPSIITL